MLSNRLLGLLSASALLAAPLAARAQVVGEAGDAGETIATAQVIAGPVAQITGQLANLGNADFAIDDIDLYRITILDTAAFGVTVNSDLHRLNNPDPDEDTHLFLFDLSGLQVGFNDDPVGPGVQAIFLPGQFSNLAAGDYILGFDQFPTRSLLDGAGFLIGFDRSLTNFPTFGTYTLNLTGTGGNRAVPEGAVPEPATWALMLLGFGAAGSALRRAQRRRSALLPA